MPDPRDFQFDLPTIGTPVGATISEEFYPGIQNTWERSTRPRNVDPINGVRAVIIHATAGATSDGAVSVMRAGSASFHWLVPDEDEPQHGRFVWACAPERRAAMHVLGTRHHPAVNNDARRPNHWSLGIEIVNRVNRHSPDPFSPWQVEATARIVRYCWGKYPNLRHVVSHARMDPERRSDPGPNFPWERFRDLVLNPPLLAEPPSMSAAPASLDDEFEDDSGADVLHET